MRFGDLLASDDVHCRLVANSKNQHCQIWIDAGDRRAVTLAADEFDALLRVMPFDVGESRDDEARILTVSPLSIYYRVREADRCVDVWSVWISQRD